MNAYLARLGIRPEIQDWLTPYYHTDDVGNLCFSYGRDTEIYGLGFHRVPLSGGCWRAGAENLVTQTVVCSSAMEGIAWLNCHPVNFDRLLLIATGSRISLPSLPKGKYVLVFGNDLLGCICDLKAAAFLAGHPVEITVENDTVYINFRHRRFSLPADTFSLSAFGRLSGYRFPAGTSKSRQHSSWLNQLLNP
jgi:hypothetical protein